MYIIQHYIQHFKWQNDEEWVWICINQFFYSCLQNMSIDNWLGVLTNLRSWSSKCKKKFSMIWYYESLHIVASLTLMRNVNTYPCILTNSNLFQTNTQVSTCCPNDAAMCKSVKTSYPGLHEEISPYYIGKLKGSPSFTDFVQD